MLRERQKESWRLCDSCSGLGRIESESNKNPRSLCLLLPRHSCAACRAEAEKELQKAHKSGNYKYIKFIEGDKALKDSAKASIAES